MGRPVRHKGGGLLVLDGHRIIVPRAMRKEVLRLLHIPHNGIVRTKQAARQRYEWPGMANDIIQLVGACEACQTLLPSQQPEPLQSTPPVAPMEEVGTDLFDFGGRPWLIVVDSYSGYPFVARLRGTQTEDILEHLRNIFHMFGYPLTIRSDNGPQYRAPFKAFCEEHDITHETASPYAPWSNGLAEAAVKAVKQLLHKTKGDTKIFPQALAEWRGSPRADGYSPDQLFLGRRKRGALPSLGRPELPAAPAGVAAARRAKYAQNQGAARELSPLRPGDVVRVQEPGQGGKWTKTGTVTSRLKHGRSYEVEFPDGWTARRNRRHLRRAQESAESAEEPPVPTEPPVSETLPRRSPRLHRAPPPPDR